MLIPKFLISRLTGGAMDLSLRGVLHSFLYPREGILPHLWFLPTLMILCLLSFLLVLAAKNKLIRWFVLVGAAVLMFLPSVPNVLCLNDVKLYLFWYFLVIFTAVMFCEKTMKKLKNVIVAVVAVVFYILFCFVDHITLADTFKGLCSIVFLLSIGMFVGRIAGDSFGKYTFPIYILSLPVQNIVEVLLSRIGMHWSVTTLTMLILGIALPYLIAVVVRSMEKNWKYKPISRCIGL